MIFDYHGTKPSSDVVDTLTGRAFIQISGSPILSHTNWAQITIEKSAAPALSSVLLSGWGYCNIQPGAGQVGFQWKYDEANGEKQSQYHLQVATNPSFNPGVLVVKTIQNQTIEPGKFGSAGVNVVLNPTPNLSDLDVGYGSHYYWRVQVKDESGDWSDWVKYEDTNDPDGDGNPKTFTTPSHPYPWVDFAFRPLLPTAKEVVQFVQDDPGLAESLCYSGGVHLCQDDPHTTYGWDFSYNPADGFIVESTYKGNATTTYNAADSYKVGLRITDPTIGSCTDFRSLSITIPLPGWKEIPPF